MLLFLSGFSCVRLSLPPGGRRRACLRNYKLVSSEKMPTGIITGHFAALSC